MPAVRLSLAPVVSPASPVSRRGTRRKTAVLAGDGPALPAFLTLAEPLVDRLAAGQGAPLAQMTAESIHELRVAARRLRELLAAFRPILDEGEVAHLRGELSWVHHQLAAKRDWDMFFAVALTPLLQEQAAGQPLNPAMRTLLATAQAPLSAARAAARTALRSRRYARCLLRCRRWLHGLGKPASSRSKPTFAEIVGRAMRKRYKRIVQLGYRHSASDEKLHRLRLRGKRLGDLMEFARTASFGKDIEHFARSLSKLQKSMGHLQDAAVSSDFANALGTLVPQARDISIAIGEREGRRIAEQRRRAAKAWQEFVSLKTF